MFFLVAAHLPLSRVLVLRVVAHLPLLRVLVLQVVANFSLLQVLVSPEAAIFPALPQASILPTLLLPSILQVWTTLVSLVLSLLLTSHYFHLALALSQAKLVFLVQFHTRFTGKRSYSFALVLLKVASLHSLTNLV